MGRGRRTAGKSQSGYSGQNRHRNCLQLPSTPLLTPSLFPSSHVSTPTTTHQLLQWPGTCHRRIYCRPLSPFLHQQPNKYQTINDPSGRPAFPKLEVTVAIAQHHQKDTGRPLGHVHQLPSSSLREQLMFYTAHPCESMEDQNLKPSKGYSGCRITQTRCRPPPRKLFKEFHFVLLNSDVCPLSGRD